MTVEDKDANKDLGERYLVMTEPEDEVVDLKNFNESTENYLVMHYLVILLVLTINILILMKIF